MYVCMYVYIYIKIFVTINHQYLRNRIAGRPKDQRLAGLVETWAGFVPGRPMVSKRVASRAHKLRSGRHT